MVTYKIFYTEQAIRDVEKIKKSNLQNNVQKLLAILALNPFQKQPSYEKLLEKLSGAYSRRINIKHRLVYQILNKERVVKTIRMWTHYE